MFVWPPMIQRSLKINYQQIFKILKNIYIFSKDIRFTPAHMTCSQIIFFIKIRFELELTKSEHDFFLILISFSY